MHNMKRKCANFKNVFLAPKSDGTVHYQMMYISLKTCRNQIDLDHKKTYGSYCLLFGSEYNFALFSTSAL